MAKIQGNEQLTDSSGAPLHSLRDINSLDREEKEGIYGRILPPRLYDMFSICRSSYRGTDGERKVHFTSPMGMGFLRIEVRLHPADRDNVLFLEIADTPYRQMELAFCVIKNTASYRYDVDVDLDGRYNYFATAGRNIPEEIRAFHAGLYPNQTHRGLRLFPDFFACFERFVDSLGMDMIFGEPLTYDNAIRYEKSGFDYLTGKQLMMEINEGFKPGGFLYERLDGSTPFRLRGMEKTVRGRSWAIHDGILDTPWDNILIYKIVGGNAGINTFPGRETENDIGYR
ncbi:MAG TPA: hypothetical protein VFG19_09060 [Geobacteraceae bacterium]|nr:hypothetical protein [Geobacteraceae bacterium]